METYKCMVTSENGLHARPAAMLVKKVKEFSSKITVEANGKKAEATKLMSLMQLGIKKGTKITVIAEGEDEKEAIESLKNYFEKEIE